MGESRQEDVRGDDVAHWVTGSSGSSNHHIVNPLVAAILMPLSSAMVLWGAAGVERRVARAERGS